jgi:hypothetical protein
MRGKQLAELRLLAENSAPSLGAVLIHTPYVCSHDMLSNISVSRFSIHAKGVAFHSSQTSFHTVYDS